jgi:RNA polymerase sigma-70 factor, ECF subfamily
MALGSGMAGDRRDEAKIIASILGGNTQQYEELIRPYEHGVYVMALSFMKNEADAEDVAQEAFLNAFRSLASFRGEAKFSTWLISITLNEARSRIRRQTASRTQPLDESPDESISVSPALLRDWREIPSAALDRKEVQHMLQQAIIALPDIYRQVLLLRDVEEHSGNETARVLAISIGTVKVRLHRARMMLQKRLAPQLKKISPICKVDPMLVGATSRNR